MNTDERVDNLDVKGEITLPTLDVKQYIGKRVLIDNVNVFKSEEYGTYYVQIETVPIDHLGKDNKEPLIIKKRVWLQTNRETGNTGWTKESIMGKLLLKYGVDHYLKLKGVEVIVQTEVRDGREWLTF